MSVAAEPRGLWDSGERVAAEPHNTLYLELLSAYVFAEQFARGGVVLDVGCGVGAGAARLATKAGRVIAIDVDPAVAVAAARRARNHGVRLAGMDGQQLAIRAQTIDLVCAFQVIEHLQAAETFVRELSRILRPSGLAVISTPNVLTHLGPRNPFHVHEFTPSELTTLLARYFPSVMLGGQRRPPEVYALEDACRKVRRLDVLRLKRFVPRRVVSLMVYAIAKIARLTPPQSLPFAKFPITADTAGAYSLFAVCGRGALPAVSFELPSGRRS